MQPAPVAKQIKKKWRERKKKNWQINEMKTKRTHEQATLPLTSELVKRKIEYENETKN